MSSGTSASIRGKNSDLTDLRIVLIGGRRRVEPSGKSSVGNIILGRDVFETNTRTAKSVVRQEEVFRRQVTVVDTPGWISHCPLDLTPNLTQLEIIQSQFLCPPGPQVFLLVMPLEIPYVGTWMSVEEHVSLLFSDRVWKHTIVVFTVADQNKIKHVRDLIRSHVELRYLTKRCEDRFHVLNITDRGDESQVKALLGKIDQMVTSNDCHYETKEHISKELKEMERTIRRKAEQRRAGALKQTTTLQKDIGGTDLRILLFGKQWSGKSSAGNTILGRSVSKTSPRSAECEVRHGVVAGRRLTVVESPGWFYNSQLRDTSEMDKLEIQNSVSLYPPGPHAVVLMLPLDEAFTKAHRVAVEEHMALLTERVWSHTIALFTFGDCLGDTGIEQHIEAEGENLRWLVDKCGNRYHVFSNEKTDDTQVTELLQKIGEMVADKEYYEVDGDVSEKLSERKRDIEEDVQTFMTRTDRQRTTLRALFEGEHQSLPDVRVMLVGGEQTGRGNAGNVILQTNVFREPAFKEFKIQNKLTECVRQQRQVAGRNVSMVICPDWSTTTPSQKMKDDLQGSVTLSSPGPHAVLLNVSVMSSFSEADRRSVKEHIELLGDRVWKYALILFTWGFWLGGRSIEEYIASEGEPLRWLLEKCGYRYHVLDFNKWDISEVTELMEKIEDVVTRNRGHFREGHGTRQDAMFNILHGMHRYSPEEWNRREEEWKKREEEIIERMLKLVVTDPEEPNRPPVRRRHSKEYTNPSLSGGTPSETGSSYYCAPDKVFDWLKRYPAHSSGCFTMTDAPSEADTDMMSVRDEDV